MKVRYMQNGESFFFNEKVIEILSLRNYKKCGKELRASSWLTQSQSQHKKCFVYQVYDKKCSKMRSLRLFENLQCI